MDSTKSEYFFCTNQALHLVSNKLVFQETAIGDLCGYLLILAIDVLYHGKHLNFDCIEKVI